MNRFRTRRRANKVKEVPNPNGRSSDESDHASLFKRGKKPKPELKPELDLATALPDIAEFRTSLLMPNLSARFSMLREQDDPTSKLGKASDDSVLGPRRVSRFGGLSDIAEVNSINGSIRPPFAAGRTDSFVSTDGYGTDDDSTYHGGVLNRPKPGEGNNLFGGRQKVYRIPAGASATETPTAGAKVLYENDVSLSAFQKLREKEREREREGALNKGAYEYDLTSRFNTSRNRAPSPPLAGYNRNRETSSSTNSGPSFGRISTAATSIASQGPSSVYGGPAPALPSNIPSRVPSDERPATKSRRLYDQGLDQHLHDQQSTAMTRLEQIARQRTMGAATPPPGQYPTLSQANSTSSLHDRFLRGGPVKSPTAAAPPHPLNSPGTGPSSNFSSFNFAQDEAESSVTSPDPSYLQSPPLSPPHSDNEDVTLRPATTAPSDRLRSARTNHFGNPTRMYDDEEYSQRQLQMQRGRDTPPLGRSSPPEQTRSPPDMSPPRAPFRPAGSRLHPADDVPAPLALSTPKPTDYSRLDAHSPLNPRSPALSSDVSSTGDGELEGERLVGLRGESMASALRPKVPVGTTYASPPLSDHPANRTPEAQWLRGDAGRSSTTSDRSVTKSVDTANNNLSASKPDVPTPTVAAEGGLSGLVRQHLRSDSGASSVYPDRRSMHSQYRSEEPELEPVPLPTSSTATDALLSHEGGNPWASKSPHGIHPAFAKDFQSQPTDPKEGANKIEKFGSKVDEAAPLSEQATRGHARGPSTETQKEREDFATELAQRRKMVQDNLRDFEKRESASLGVAVKDKDAASNSVRDSFTKVGNSLNHLKTRSRRNSLLQRSESPQPQSKAMKMLGIKEFAAKTDLPSAQKPVDDRWREEEERMLRSIVRGPKIPQPVPSLQQPIQPHGGDQQRPRMNSEPANQQRPGNRNQGSPPSTSGSDSNRSISEGQRSRSKSRNGRMPGPANRSVRSPSEPGPDLSTLQQGPLPPKLGPLPPVPHLSTNGSGSPASPISPARLRSDSKPASPSRHGSRNPSPIRTNVPMNLTVGSAAPRASPVTPFSANSTPSLFSAGSDDRSALTSPATSVHNADQYMMTKSLTVRKRVINKADISEPTFLSSTSNISNITTISLRPNGQLSNMIGLMSGHSGAVSPSAPSPSGRRRFQGAFGRAGKAEQTSSMVDDEERSTFSDNEGDGKGSRWPRSPKLKKSSSEGGNLHARAKQQAAMTPSPPMPTMVKSPHQPVIADGSMF